MKHLFATLAIGMMLGCSIAAVAQDSIGQWRLATNAEINAEIGRESKAMGKAGLYGDPGCTVGVFMGDEEQTYDDSPCALTNGKGEFTSLIEIRVGKTRCRLTWDQSIKFQNNHTLMDACKQGKLPKLVLYKSRKP